MKSCPVCHSTYPPDFAVFSRDATALVEVGTWAEGTRDQVKKGSSKWIKTKGAAFRKFHWQDGYAAFSVSPSKAAIVEAYIVGQKEHHRRRSFQEELIQFLRKHGVEYDERYIWT